jgi:hypothetical protein
VLSIGEQGTALLPAVFSHDYSCDVGGAGHLKPRCEGRKIGPAGLSVAFFLPDLLATFAALELAWPERLVLTVLTTLVVPLGPLWAG